MQDHQASYTSWSRPRQEEGVGARGGHGVVVEMHKTGGWGKEGVGGRGGQGGGEGGGSRSRGGGAGGGASDRELSSELSRVGAFRAALCRSLWLRRR